MNKKIIAIIIIGAYLVSGCSLVTRFEEAKDAYLETRVAEMLAEETTVEQPAEEVSLEEQVLEEAEEKVIEGEEAESVVEEEVEPDDSDDDAPIEEESAEDETDADEEPVETEEPTPTIESDDPGIYLGDADWVDEMETGEFWPTGSDYYLSAEYENGTLKFVALSEVNGWRIASTPVLGNAYIEAEIKMGTCSQTDGYGFIFRVPENVGYNRGYLFGITCDGRYSLRSWDGLTGEQGNMIWLKYYTSTEGINQGKDQTNRIGVMTLDDRILLFVNGAKIDEITDDTYAEGFFGLYINRDNTENLTMNVEKVSYWTDPQEN